MPSLSVHLRERTSSLHRQIEVVLRLPEAIQTRNDYHDWLGRYLGFYEPLEAVLAIFPEWDVLGLEMATRSHTRCLVGDLVSLGGDPNAAPHATQAMLPELPTFAHALGALYVIEGATLGGRLILRDLEARLKQEIGDATHFFGGRGDSARPMWRIFRAALDSFGVEYPQLAADVVIGAERTFVAMQSWFAPFCDGRVLVNEPA
jgi:heme oxygenase